MMRLLFTLSLIILASSMVMATIGGGADQGELLAELPNQPMVFNSPEELRTYLQELDKYFAIVGRPRFGRTLGNGYSRNIFPYFRANPLPPSF